MSSRIVIVGGVAAGSKAAATAHRRDPRADVVLVTDEPDVAYSACGLPYHLATPAEIPRAKLVARTVEALRSDGIDVRPKHRVAAIDLDAGRLAVTDLASGATTSEPFDALLLATGAAALPAAYPIEAGAPPVVTLRRLRDLDRCGAPGAGGRVVVVGGGYVGLEAVETYRHLGCEVTVVERLPRLLPAFAPELAARVTDLLAAEGVRLITGAGPVGAGGGGLALDDGTRLPADLVLHAAGVRPVVELGAQAGLAIGPTGALATDDRQETARRGVFAAGDCAETIHRITGRPVWLPLGDVAARQGRVAGENLAGGDARFPGVLGTAIFRVFRLAVGRTGLSVADAAAAGIDAVAVRVTAPSRARYMPGNRPLDLVVVAERGSGRVLGAQAVGEDSVDKAIDILATAAWAGLGVDDLADLDLAYAPPFSPVFAPVQVAGELLRGAARRAGPRTAEPLHAASPRPASRSA